MSDLKLSIKKRKDSDRVFAENYDEDYEDFKINALLRTLREESGKKSDINAK